jgi:TIR domain-containing protein
LEEKERRSNDMIPAPTPTRTVSRLHVFLSYRTVEAKFADVLKEHLVQDFIGLVEVFLASDATSVPAGTHWLEEIVEGLRQAQLQIIICSNYSMYRPWINYEAGAARVRGIPIIPLCHSGLNPDQLPVPLSESEGGILTEASAVEKLYMRIAELIGSFVPGVDFEKYAKEFKALETELEAQKESIGNASADSDAFDSLEPELIQNPQVLCVTSPQFRELGFANQLQIVLDAFPKNIKHDVVLNSMGLSRILLKERVDIIHIAAFVCPRGGDLYFSPVELPLGKSSTEDLDVLKPEALVELLKKARTRLVVLGGSESLVLATELLPVTHVIAARDMVSAKAMARWVETFYRTLTTEPLATASEIASRVSQAPMKLYAQQRQAPIVRFGRAGETISVEAQ